MIPLGRNGTVTLIDDQDEVWVSRHKWTTNGRYVCRSVRKSDGRNQTVYLHRLIANPPAGMEIDHVNGDKLDNRRANLRVVTRAQNEQNRHRAQSGSTTGVRGVFPRTDYGRTVYSARVWSNGRSHAFGVYPTIEEADAAAQAGRRALMTHSPETL